MVLVIALHNLSDPFADLTRAMVLPMLKLCLDDFELRDHPLLRRNAPDVKGSAAREVSTEMREPQKRKGLRFFLATPLSLSDGEPPEPRSDASCPDVIPDRTSPAVPETPPGTARRRFDFESPPQDRQHIGRQ